MKKNLVVSASLPPPARTLASIVQMLTRASRSKAAKLIHDGQVTVNGSLRTQSFDVAKIGDRIEVDYTPASAPLPKGKTPFQNMQVEFEDDAIIVVTKPAHVLTVPTLHREPTTLISMVTRHIQRTDPTGQAFCVHRLDRGVSGLLVMAKSLETAEALRSQFAARKPQRRYVAIVLGVLDQTAGKIESYLATDEDLNRYSVQDASQGELAITHYRQSIAWKSASLIELELETGRRNQIRVHMAELGHPILGDPRYGRAYPAHPAWPHKRLALHAETLGFQHPSTGKAITFQSPWPEEFRIFKRQAR